MQYIDISAGTTYSLVLGEDIFAMNTSKIYLQCDTSDGSGAINILLPKITIPAGGSIKNWFLEIFINDVGNNASTNNIKITPSPIDGGDTINGSTSQITLTSDGVTGRLVITGQAAWDFNIGSSSVSVNTQLSVQVSYNPATFVLTSSVSGGTASSYEWSAKSYSDVAGEDDLTFTGSTSNSTVQVNQSSGNIMLGMACVKVTDTLGRISYGYFMLHVNPNN